MVLDTFITHEDSSNRLGLILELKEVSCVVRKEFLPSSCQM